MQRKLQFQVQVEFWLKWSNSGQNGQIYTVELYWSSTGQNGQILVKMVKFIL